MPSRAFKYPPTANKKLILRVVCCVLKKNRPMWCVGCSRNDWLWDSRARGWLRGPKAPKSRSSYAILSSSFDLAPARHEIKQKHPHQTYRDTTHAQYFFTGTYVTVTVPATLWHVGEPGSDLDLSNVSLSGAHPAGTSLTHSTKRLQSLYLPTSFLPLLCVPVCPSFMCARLSIS